MAGQPDPAGAGKVFYLDTIPHRVDTDGGSSLTTVVFYFLQVNAKIRKQSSKLADLVHQQEDTKGYKQKTRNYLY